jgi:hypothetical protein
MSFADGSLQIRFVPVGVEDWIEYKRNDQSKDVIFRKVLPKDVERYPQPWAAYDQARPRDEETGTPLTALPGVSIENALMIRLKGAMNVEQLAQLDNFAAGAIADNGVALRDIAKLFLAASASKVGLNSKPIEKAKAA